MTDEGRANDGDRRSRITLFALLAAVGVVVVIALIAVFARGGPPQYDEDTPEGVVQRYAQAVIDGDVETALTLLVPEIADSCDRLPTGIDDYRVTLLETIERSDTARVEVLVTTIYESGPLGTNEYQSEEVFGLVAADGGWLIDATPWQFTICADSGVQ